MKFLRNVISVLISNASILISGVLVGFVLPLILSIEDYGLFKTFTLYVTYSGLFTIGIIDGIVLKFGSNNYDELDTYRLRSYFRWYMIENIFFMIIISLTTLFSKGFDIRFITIMLAINMVAINIGGYFRQISEITQRFKEYSILKLVQSTLNIVSIAILYLLFINGYKIGYEIYTFIVVLCNFIIAFWYMKIYKEIIVGPFMPLKDTFSEVKNLILIGVPLLLANLTSTLILTLDRQFVSILFDNKTYAVYAFAYNLLSMLTIATMAVSTVLYPTLKRTEFEIMKKRYGNTISITLIMVYSLMILYFPLCIMIQYILPNYIEALEIFRIVFPGLPITTAITVVMHNYYKALGDSTLYFKRSIKILILSVVANMIAYLIFKTPISISIASVIVIFMWYVYAERNLVKKMGSKQLRNILYIVLCITSFLLISSIPNLIVGFILYAISFSIISILVYKKLIFILVNKLKK